MAMKEEDWEAAADDARDSWLCPDAIREAGYMGAIVKNALFIMDYGQEGVEELVRVADVRAADDACCEVRLAGTTFWQPEFNFRRRATPLRAAPEGQPNDAIREAGWTYECDSGAGWETHVVLNTAPNLASKCAPTKHYGSTDIRNVRPFYYTIATPKVGNPNLLRSGAVRVPDRR